MTWIHQICHDTGVTVTETLQLADDRPFWWMIVNGINNIQNSTKGVTSNYSVSLIDFSRILTCTELKGHWRLFVLVSFSGYVC